MTIDAPTALLDRVLSALEVRSAQGRRSTLAPGATLPLAAGIATLGYVVDGEVGGTDGQLHACGADRDAPPDAPPSLRAGDAFLSSGASPSALVSASGAHIMTAEVDLAWPLTAPMPAAFLFVSRFADSEPAAAALAANLGPAAGEIAPARSGDPVICRMMMTTVALSFVRAWAAAGCAPPGWPTSAADPFLLRVAQAITDDPGRAWTLDTLASIAAMSRSTLAERFRTAFGSTPANFVTDVRMRRAQALLDAGHSVSDTSRALGYASDEGFSRAFRRHVGVVPSRWAARPDAMTA